MFSSALSNFYTPVLIRVGMAIKGLTQTSSLITIGFSASELVAGTFLQERVDLQLNPLDNEVFVVQSINLDPSDPEAIPGVDTSVACSLSSTGRTTIGQLSDSTVIATARNNIRAFAAAGVGFQTQSMETPPAGLEYIAVISTNDFFVQVDGSNNIGTKSVHGKMYGFRAKASSSVYAALVQSELLSA